ncbi:LacI family DNA-binding transcriptional regulator [Undibacterium sp. TJN19]|uniref:LacI family DNA-binding transcriptional regulator n=1 Tax=Undibacterium sp. TJN19 TaxID=3413055 RepID=UPI003BF05E97
MSAKKKGIANSESGVTMEHLAGIAGVSTITVSRALRNSPLVTEETREKIRKIAEEQGYRFNVSARNLRLRRSHSVAVVVEMTPASDRPMSDPYPLELLGGITQELTTAGYSVVLTSMQLIDTPPVQGADGLILLGQGSHGEAVRHLQRSGLPMVIWGAPDANQPGIVVGSDNRKGGASVAGRFIQQGRKKLLFLGDINHAEIQERCAGFMDALGEQQHAVSILHPKAFTFEAGFDCMSAYLKKKDKSFDAVFAASDLLAMGAIRALNENNLAVPEQVSVIGYDDTPGAASFVPPLTSVHQYLRDGGVLLAKKILALINNEAVESEVLQTLLVVRQT